MKVILDVVEGPRKGLSFVFDRPDTFIVGRSPLVHCSMPEDAALSRDHFLIEVNPPRCDLRDLGSTNGTFVNDRRVQRARLVSGDRIGAGTSLFRLRVEEATVSDSQELLSSTSRTVPIPEVPAGAPVSCARCATPAPPGTGAGGGVEALRWLCAPCRAHVEPFPQPAPHYMVMEELGRGAMGVVYLARHLLTGREVAMKLIVPEAAATRTAIDRFQREMSVISQLKHPNIVEWLEQGATRRQIWFAMEYVEGGKNLESLAKARPGSYPIRQACRLACQVLKGLAHAHGLGFVHRDIKPENILIARGKSGLVAKISDFGLAKSYRSVGLSGLTFSGEMRGTVPFMPPEQMLDFKKVLPSADLYSTAATLYFLISGQFLYDEVADVSTMIRLLLEESPVPIQRRRDDVPDALAAVLHKCLAREPADRYPTAAEMRQALRPFC